MPTSNPCATDTLLYRDEPAPCDSGGGRHHDDHATPRKIWASTPVPAGGEAAYPCPPRRRARLGELVVGLATAVTAVACGGSDDKGSNADVTTEAGGGAAASGAGGLSSGAGGASAAAGRGVGGAGTGTGGIPGRPSGAACSGLPLSSVPTAGDAATCAGVTLEAERVDVDMYVMMDRSVSMAEQVGTTGKIRWDFVREAVRDFVQDPAAAGIGVGIQFFGQSGSRDDALDCDVSRYATPAVPIGLASQTGADVVAAVDRTLPGGLTPTMPALQGAVEYAKSWAATSVGRATVVVLVTDGFPTQCQDPVSVAAIAGVAKAAAEGSPPVRTFVVGLAAGYNLDTIARSGGTERAFLVDEGNIAASFVSTLLNISNNQLACEYEIPTPSDPNLILDPDKVQIVYTPAVGDSEEIPRAQSVADCASSTAGGWYYDSPTSPSKILVCPCSCARFAAGTVDIRLGCEPQRIGPR